MDDDVYELLMQARDELSAGRLAEGPLTLERTIDPKWADRAECDGQYRMFRPDGGISASHNFFAKALGVQVAVHCGERA